MRDSSEAMTHSITFDEVDFHTINQSTVMEFGAPLMDISMEDPTDGFVLIHEALINNPHIYPYIETSTVIGGMVSSYMDGPETARSALLKALEYNFPENEPILPARLFMSYFIKKSLIRRLISPIYENKIVNVLNVTVEPQQNY